MKCHYEVLGVTPNCGPEDLKKAYRKLALEWHPDKNLDRLEEATETFQLIQQAYEILIDPQERAWYDRHKDDILRGGAEEAYKDDCLNVYQYFNASCFKGYSDEKKGFYTIYRQVFEKIATEDKPFMDEEDIDIPNFGYSYSSYDEVVHNFYAYWQSYCTSKSYSWVDKFDLCEARKSGVGRQVIRAMEKENKKLRDQHKKMRNEEVRQLVSFVRKRDKRVHAHKKMLEELKAEKARRAEELRKKQVQERNKLLENYKETEWSSMSQFEDHFNEMENALDNTFGTHSPEPEDEENLNYNEELYCIACEKDFRSVKAMKNHENSKKHNQNVVLLKFMMEEEEAMENSNAEENNIDEDDDNTSEKSNSDENITSEALLDELIKSSTKSKKKKKKNKASLLETEESTDSSILDSKMGKIKIEDDVLTNESQRDMPEEEVPEVKENLTTKSEPIKKKGKKEKTRKDANCCTATSPVVQEKAEKPPTLCETCNTTFKSRNKLFEHLKESGHAVYKNESSANQRSSTDGLCKKQRRKKL